MVVRIISAIVAIPLLLFFIIYSGYPLIYAVGFISLVGMYELYKAVSGKIKPIHLIGFLSTILYLLVMHFGSFLGIDINTKAIIIMSYTVLLIMLVFFYKNTNINDASIVILSFFYITFSLNCVIELREDYTAYVWLPFVIAFGSDTGAYFIGSAIGKHKLCEGLSPKKSIEGAVGGVILSAICTVIYCYVANKFGNGIKNTNINLSDNIIELLIFGAIGSILAQLGDLIASSIKRYTGIKDYGRLMPGHGGVLDRFDSVLLTLPFVYLYCKMFL